MKLESIKPIPASAVTVSLGKPVVVSMADPAERTWGYWQFPTISRMPGGEILLTVNNNQDDDLCYGHAAPAWLSHDDGQSWHPAELDEKGLTVTHSPIGEVFDGEFLCVPMPLGFRPSELPKRALQRPVSQWTDYIPRSFHRLERFPQSVKDYFGHLRGLRWTPRTRQWAEEMIAWDMKNFLLRLDGGGMVGHAWSRTSLEYRPIRVGSELFDANYKVAYIHDDGTAPRGFEVWCMASNDNGRSWQRRGLIATDPTGRVPPTETSMSLNTQGELVCVVRTTHRLQLPMWVTLSQDAGRTWSKPKTLFDHGVLPTLELLRNGVLALAFGRPGVHLSFSPDGSAQEWTEPIEVLPTGIAKGSKWTWEKILQADPNNVNLQKDGYTSIVPLGDDTFLIAYCDLAHGDIRGRKRRAVKVRTVTVRRR
jgi:hypothetical protein